MKLWPWVHMMLSAKFATHGVGGCAFSAGTDGYSSPASRWEVRSKSVFFGLRLYVNRLTLALKPNTVVGVTL